MCHSFHFIDSQMLVLGCVFFINKSGFDFENPDNIHLLRISFCIVNAIELVVQLYISKTLQRKRQADDDYSNKKLYFPGPVTPFDPTPEYDPTPRTTAEYEEEKSAKVHTL